MNLRIRRCSGLWGLCAVIAGCGASSSTGPSGSGGATGTGGGAGGQTAEGGTGGRSTAGTGGTGGSLTGFGGNAGAPSTGTGGTGTTGTGGTGTTGTGGTGTTGTGGTGTTGTGGSVGTGGTGGPGSGGSAATGGVGGTSSSGGSGGSVSTGGSLTIMASWPSGAIMTGVRDVTTPALPTQILQVHNGGTTPLTITALTVGGTDKAAFQITSPPQLPASLAAGASLAVTVQASTATGSIPAAPVQNSGAALAIATLTATAGAVTAQANLYDLVLTSPTHEPTLGEILTTLGYNKLNVGIAQNDCNPISPSDATKLPKGIEAGTDEVAGQLFTKAGAGNVTMVEVARFSPMGPMPFGWYPMGSPTTHNMAGIMETIPSDGPNAKGQTLGQNSHGARMVLSPVTGTQSFDPGAMTFGLWVYSDQATQMYDSGGTATNGDYDYSQDAPNSPAGTHRTKVYPLKDATGALVANTYLVAVEEAGNGDYQDYVFVLSNVKAQ
jgi:hypothetical protein